MSPVMQFDWFTWPLHLTQPCLNPPPSPYHLPRSAGCDGVTPHL